MKKSLILGVSILFGILIKAQDIEETTFTEKNKTMDAFGFTNPVCNKDVLVNTWKNFIKKQGGKVKGGIVNKAMGSNINFIPSGENWNGYFAYSFNNDNTMSIFVAFQNMQGDFLTSKSSNDEVLASGEALKEFRLTVQKDCNMDDLTNAKSYSNSLSKEKIRNSDKIVYLEKSIQTDQQKVDINEGKSLSEKERLAIEKVKQRIVSNESEIETLKERNTTLDEEIKAQGMVIQRFQKRKDLLDGKSDTFNDSLKKTDYLEENIIKEESIQQQKEDISKQYFDR